MTYNTQPTPQTVPLGSTAEVRTIPEQPATGTGTGAASQSGLFPAETSLPVASGGLPPSRLDFNGLFKVLGASQYFQQRGGVWAWDNSYDYDASALVSYSGAVYVALAPSGPSESVGAVTPGTAAADDIWQKLGDGTGAWVTDGSIRVADCDSTYQSAVYTFNDGDSTVIIMPSSFTFNALYGSKVYNVSEDVIDTGTWSVVPSSLAIYSLTMGRSRSNRNTSTVTNKWQFKTTDTDLTLDTWLSSVSYEHVRMSTDTTAFADAAATYGWSGYVKGAGFSSRHRENADGVQYFRHTIYAANGVLSVRSAPFDSGTDPTPDITVTCEDSAGNTVSMTQVQECKSVFLNDRGVRWAGYNTVGSTIMACRKTQVSAPGNNYGTLVAGSDLCWAAWDNEGGQLANSSAGSLGLTGTWVKVSGTSNRNYGDWGMGLYRRII